MDDRPPPTPEQIAEYDLTALMEGGNSYAPGDPEPGHNHCDAFWWGWWCRRNPRPDEGDERATSMYWAMRQYVRYRNGVL